ncbi:hypothetical protein SAMN05444372_106166 [Flavobacterium micromati]|uniref:Uncharacterized protein n=1 Tax=Flavobacterium micromati TaxID=229205 RepID=A0A1M5K938_9FLAO|nr:hypothetical protein SAMN05444372_106166 [Flavobacterium micromati]
MVFCTFAVCTSLIQNIISTLAAGFIYSFSFCVDFAGDQKHRLFQSNSFVNLPNK